MDMKFEALGQVGYKIIHANTVIYIDPYLSNYVEKIEGQKAKRLYPIKINPENITDADWVFITHEHIDHCDPETLLPLSKSSPKAKFVCPYTVISILREIGISNDRLFLASSKWFSLSEHVIYSSVPSAHPTIEINQQGLSRYVGYIFDFNGFKIYHSGDTALNKEVYKHILKHRPIDLVFLPVNERNFFRESEGIIGNLTIREAFALAEDLEAKYLVPMHWDMFPCNQVFIEEINLLYEKLNPDFDLLIYPEAL
jgi:L-ascorbate 6-phosphate lactonase